MPIVQTRRRFLTTLSLAGVAGLVRAQPSLAAEGELETTTVRIAKTPAICLAPQYISEELLRAEGFTDIRYVAYPIDVFVQAIGRGDADFSTTEATWLLQQIDAGAPLVAVAGVHVGCYELFAQQGIRRIGDLKGKRVAVDAPGLFSVIAAQVGFDANEAFERPDNNNPGPGSYRH